MRPFRPALRRLSYAIAALYLLYLLAANLLLNTSLGVAAVNARPQAFQARWAWAFSLYPGHIHARDLQLRGHARTTRWAVRGHAADGRILLLPLLRRELRFGTIDAERVSVDMQRSDVDLQPPPFLPDAWTIRLDGVRSTSLQRVRIRRLLLDGTGSAQFGLVKQLRGGALEILPSTLRMSAGRLRYLDAPPDGERIAASESPPPVEPETAATAALREDRPATVRDVDRAARAGETWRTQTTQAPGTGARAPGRIGAPGDTGIELLRGARIDLRFSLPAHTREQASGAAKLDLVDARLRVDASAPALAVSAGDGGVLDVDVAEDRGSLRADLRLRDGQFEPGGQLHWTAPLRIVDEGGRAHLNRLQLDATIDADAIALRAAIPSRPGGLGQLDADLRLAGRRWQASDWRTSAARLSGRVDAQWRFASLAWLGSMLTPAPWLRLDGAGELQAALRIDAGALAVGSRLDVPQVSVQADVLDNRFAGRAHGQARVVAGAAGPQARIDMTVDRFTLAARAAPGRPDLHGRDLRIAMTSSADARRFREALRVAVRFDAARVPDLRTYNRYLPGSSLRLLGGAGTMSGDATIDAGGEVASGRLQMAGDGISVALGVSQLTGDIRLDSRVRRAQRQGDAFDIEGLSLGLSGVRLRGSDDPPWWAQMQLDQAQLQPDGAGRAGAGDTPTIAADTAPPQAQLDWGQPLRIRGSGHVRMRDVSLLLSLFAQRSAFPAWITRLVDAGETRARADVLIQGDEVILDRLVASNARVDLNARLHIRDGVPAGDLYARWGVLGLGVALQGNRRDFKLVGAKRWYDDRPDLLPPPSKR